MPMVTIRLYYVIHCWCTFGIFISTDHAALGTCCWTSLIFIHSGYKLWRGIITVHPSYLPSDWQQTASFPSPSALLTPMTIFSLCISTEAPWCFLLLLLKDTHYCFGSLFWAIFPSTLRHMPHCSNAFLWVWCVTDDSSMYWLNTCLCFTFSGMVKR